MYRYNRKMTVQHQFAALAFPEYVFPEIMFFRYRQQ
jgi:hypothetical protein